MYHHLESEAIYCFKTCVMCLFLSVPAASTIVD